MHAGKLTLMSFSLLLSNMVLAHGPVPVSLKGVPIPPVPGLNDGADPIVVDKAMAIALGKALFWDMNVGSDGMACASCHFHAGADNRVKNQLNPGLKSPQASGQTFEKTASGAAGGPNYLLKKSDFPLHQYADPLDKSSGVIFDTDDVVSSSGVFHGKFQKVSRAGPFVDSCERDQDAIFHVGATNTRQVEPRNTPTVLNAVFYHRNFWDGRANNIFNGSNNWGDRDPNAGVWVKNADNSVSKQRLHLINSSLASLAVAPPLNNLEMSCAQRTFPALARKLLQRRALEKQRVHPNDSVFAPLKLLDSAASRGLNVSYKSLIVKAFNPKYWSYSGTADFGSVSGQLPYNQVEANFTLFYGVAVQLYISTLVTDDAPFDRLPRDENRLPIGLTASQQNGFNLFSEFHCNICHAGPAFTAAAITTNAMLIEADPNALGTGNASQGGGISRNIINHDTMINGINRFMDFGFFNTGVTDPNGDPGLGGVDDFGNPLAFVDQYFAYLAGDSSKILDKQVGIENVRSCDFLKPIALDLSSIENPTLYQQNYFNSTEAGSIKADPNGKQRCVNILFGAKAAYIPTPEAAQAALKEANSRRLAKATQGAFKVPTLRNIELTGPYMHNGSLSTLEQVIAFYSRATNFDSAFKHAFIFPMSTLQADVQARYDLIAFLQTLTDERVRYEKAPFDHPELRVPNGHPGDNLAVTPGNALDAQLASEDYLSIPAVGAEGKSTPLQSFDSYLAP